jgi:ABC-type nickel/cobalt efflux system permease component RcnA
VSPLVAKKIETSHEPTPDELAHAETGELHHPGDIAGEVHGTDDHGETHGHDDHAHAEEALGPVDAARWGAFALGLAAGLLVALCLVLTIAVIGT